MIMVTLGIAVVAKTMLESVKTYLARSLHEAILETYSYLMCAIKYPSQILQ